MDSQKPHKTRRPIRRFLSGLLIIALSILGCLLALFLHTIGSLSFLPSDTLARAYLDAVMRRDLEGAANLYRTHSPTILSTIQQEIETYGGAEIRSLTASVEPGTGSSETIEFVTLKFEYRSPGSTQWREGTITLMTDYEPLHLRYLSFGG